MSASPSGRVSNKRRPDGKRVSIGSFRREAAACHFSKRRECIVCDAAGISAGIVGGYQQADHFVDNAQV